METDTIVAAVAENDGRRCCCCRQRQRCLRRSFLSGGKGLEASDVCERFTVRSKLTPLFFFCRLEHKYVATPGLQRNLDLSNELSPRQANYQVLFSTLSERTDLLLYGFHQANCSRCLIVQFGRETGAIEIPKYPCRVFQLHSSNVFGVWIDLTQVDAKFAMQVTLAMNEQQQIMPCHGSCGIGLVSSQAMDSFFLALQTLSDDDILALDATFARLVNFTTTMCFLLLTFLLCLFALQTADPAEFSIGEAHEIHEALAILEL